jgi:hypothetical protein
MEMAMMTSALNHLRAPPPAAGGGGGSGALPFSQEMHKRGEQNEHLNEVSE